MPPTDEMCHRLALYYEQQRAHPPPQTLEQVPLNRRQRIVDDARKALTFALED